MNDIVQSVQRVTDMIGEITAASSEQSAGVGQVNQSIGNLDQMTQQNAALVEESAAAAQSLREQAEQLAHVVSRFKVDPASYGAARAAPAQAFARAQGQGCASLRQDRSSCASPCGDRSAASIGRRQCLALRTGRRGRCRLGVVLRFLKPWTRPASRLCRRSDATLARATAAFEWSTATVTLTAEPACGCGIKALHGA
jgi:hypothetical protein